MPSRPVQALLAVEPGVDAEDVRDSLPGGEDFNVVAVVERRRRGAVSGCAAASPDLLLVACAGYSDRALLLLDGVARQNPGPERDGARARVAQRLPQARVRGRRRRHRHAPGDAGADPLRDPQAHGPQAGRESSPPVNENSRLVCVLGPKGGTGKTLSVHEPLRLPRAAGERVALIDLDLQFGDVALCLGLPPEKTVYDLAQSPGRPRLGQAPGVHGPPLVGRPHAHRSAAARSGERRRRASSCARSTRSCARTTTGSSSTRLRASRPRSSRRSTTRPDIVMVGMLDSLSLKNTKLGLETPRAHEVRHRPHLPAAEPRAQPRRDQPVGRGSGARAHARRLHSFRPRDPAHRSTRASRSSSPRPQSEPAEAFGRPAPTCLGRAGARSGCCRPGNGHQRRQLAVPSRRRLFGRKG